eukprot:NODE_17_length_48642_cov_1.199349.p1 type:complete len:1328 gc:universal NODE_17_length_48642_cov_1.199349:26317-30300(+)
MFKNHWKIRKEKYEGLKAEEILPEYFSEPNALCLGLLYSKIDNNYIQSNSRVIIPCLMRQLLKKTETESFLISAIVFYPASFWEELKKISAENNIKLIIKNLNVAIDIAKTNIVVYKSLKGDQLQQISELFAHANQQIRQLTSDFFIFVGQYHKISKYIQKCSDSLKLSLVEKIKSFKPNDEESIDNHVIQNESDRMEIDVKPLNLEADERDYFLNSLTEHLNVTETKKVALNIPLDELQNTKWKIKFEALNSIIDIIKPLNHEEYFEIFLKTKLLKSLNVISHPSLPNRLDDNLLELMIPLLRDKNVNVCAAAAQISLFALKFNRSEAFAFSIMSLAIDRLKDKKQVYQDLLQTCCCLCSMNSDLVIEMLSAAISHKIPLIKISVLASLLNVFKLLPLLSYKAWVEVISKNIDDRDGKVRDFTFELLGLIKYIGLKNNKEIAFDFDKFKLDKINSYFELYDKQMKKVQFLNVVLLFNPANPGDNFKANNAQERKTNQLPKKVTIKSSLKKKRKLEERTPQKKAALSHLLEEKIIPLQYTDEDSTWLVSKYLSEEDIKGLKSPDWKTRLEIVKGLDFACSFEERARIFQFSPGFGEKNFQVCHAILEKLINIKEPISGSHVSLIATFLIDRMTDLKLSAIVKLVLKSLIENSTVDTVIKSILSYAINTKSPKFHIEFANWMYESTMEFGSFTVPASLELYAKMCLKHSNQKLRTEILKVIGTLNMKGIFVELSDSQMKVVGEYNANAPGIKRHKSVKPNNNLSDYSEKISALIPSLREKQWKLRKEALLQLKTYFESNTMDNIAFVYPALRERLLDSNKNLIVVTLNVISKNRCPSILKCKELIHQICICFGDTKVQIRDAAMNCLQDISKIVPLLDIISLLGTFLVNDNLNITKEILRFITVSITPDFNIDLIAESIVNCLNSKHIEVKKYSQTLLANISVAVLKKLLPNEQFLSVQLYLNLNEKTEEGAIISISSCALPKADRMLKNWDFNKLCEKSLNSYAKELFTSQSLQSQKLIRAFYNCNDFIPILDILFKYMILINRLDLIAELLHILKDLNYRICDDELNLIFDYLLGTNEFRLLYNLYPYSKMFLRLVHQNSEKSLSEIKYILSRNDCKDLINDNMDLINTINNGELLNMIQSHIKSKPDKNIAETLDVADFSNEALESVDSRYKIENFSDKFSHKYPTIRKQPSFFATEQIISQLNLCDPTKSYYALKEFEKCLLSDSISTAQYLDSLIKVMVDNFNKHLNLSLPANTRLIKELCAVFLSLSTDSNLISALSDSSLEEFFRCLLFNLKSVKDSKIQSFINSVIVKSLYNLNRNRAFQ